MSVAVTIILSLTIIGLSVVGVFTTFAVSEISQKKQECALEISKLGLSMEGKKADISRIKIERPNVRAVMIPDNSIQAYEDGYRAGAKDMQNEAIKAVTGEKHYY